MKEYGNLAEGFANSFKSHPERLALEVAEKMVTYRQLAENAGQISKALKIPAEEEPLIAIFASRSLTAYAGILAILSTGKGYVPLNPSFPTERNARMLQLSQCRTIIVGNECLGLLQPILDLLESPMTLIFPHTEERMTPDLTGEHQYLHSRDVEAFPNDYEPELVPIEQTAYLLFTSGSTGDPKGVPVSIGNALSYIQQLTDLYQFGMEDRFSQFFELTFDLSVHDLFLSWQSGACLCVIPQKSIMAPGNFIKKQNLTVWFSVPSAGMFMAKMRMLKPNSLPSLRISLFCGEAFPESLAQQWQAASPNSVVDNLYGPTEATISISRYRWDAMNSPGKCINGVVPIGWLFEGQSYRIIDKESREVEPGEDGELCLAGSQVVKGYYNNPEKTREQFFHFPNHSNLWYRTGDLTREGTDGCLYYLGRLDSQIQIRGYRVELQEVEHVLRGASGTDLVAAIAWPLKAGRADQIDAFICGGHQDTAAILETCQKTLPDYMVPQNIHNINDMPLNASGKIDKKQLAERLSP